MTKETIKKQEITKKQPRFFTAQTANINRSHGSTTRAWCIVTFYCQQVFHAAYGSGDIRPKPRHAHNTN
jgi:hypothetical protein